MSFSFRAECMQDVSAVMSGILMHPIVDWSMQTYAVSIEDADIVEVALVFKCYENGINEFITAVTLALATMRGAGSELHFINETINFTDEYDGSRTYNFDQRNTIVPRLLEKLAMVPFLETHVNYY